MLGEFNKGLIVLSQFNKGEYTFVRHIERINYDC